MFCSQREFTDECVFNEKIEQHHYNTYSSTKYSNARRTLYLGMTRKGEVRRVQVRTGTVLGRLSTFTRVLTQSVDAEEAARIHGRTVCHPVPPPPSRLPRPPRCRLRIKGRPRRRKKRPDESEDPPPLRRPLRRKCEQATECQRRLLIGRKRKSRLGPSNGAPRRLRHRKHRTAVRLKEEEEQELEQEQEERDDEEDDEDVTMTTEDELLADDHTELFQDNNDNE
ncbi:unnamed protein product [Nesidiocoris tenuis]|uniref:Fibroblast growth factor n=1 Tax=Nesidiocoris tenuis TaxID=355587 RepID=A0A6H5H2I4_9HEMI|nr:unnamed protein product [Nesidiocoris tenuis]CAB0011367.1 unnamed protein product [Nesidiocoris tenuis]